MNDQQLPNDYRIAQKVLHWLMGLFIILDLLGAQQFGGVMEESERVATRMDHATLGTTLGVLLLLRLYFRLRSGVPMLPPGMPGWQVTSARTVHVLLYIGMVCLIGTGLLTATQATDPILIYGSIEVTVGKLDDESFKFVRQFHELMTLIMIALITLHVLAALSHQFVRKDGVLVKMLKFWKSEQLAPAED
jgi:cytochrome b561